MATSTERIVVIGNGMVGHQFLVELSEQGAMEGFEVVVFCEEPRTAYDRVHLSEYFSGRSAEELSLAPADFYMNLGIRVLVGDAVARIDRERKTVTSDSGETLAYSKLVFATGSYPFVPPIPGRERERCLVYRTLEDLERITQAAGSSRVGAVVGGGLLGLEAAKALRDLGLETHVVEFAPRLMAVQIDQGGGGILRRKIEKLGVRVHTGKSTKEIVDGEQ